jgi:hypothetical protein
MRRGEPDARRFQGPQTSKERSAPAREKPQPILLDFAAPFIDAPARVRGEKPTVRQNPDRGYPPYGRGAIMLSTSDSLRKRENTSAPSAGVLSSSQTFDIVLNFHETPDPLAAV